MSPLGDAIYHFLAGRAGMSDPLVTFQQLVEGLPSLEAPYEKIARNDERLYKALTEVTEHCRERGLPTLSALVVRSLERTPAGGYFAKAHPEAGFEEDARNAAWRRELTAIKSAIYPHGPAARGRGSATSTAESPGKSSTLGHFQIAEAGFKASVVYAGRVSCSRCGQTLDAVIERNAAAVSPKQPAFVFGHADGGSAARPLGHLFIGTNLKSPMLYYGALNHCGAEQRIAVFYNRAIRDRADAVLIVVPSLSGQGAGEEESFRLS